MALLRCAEKNVLPILNFPLSEYGASKDKGMVRVVREVVHHFQPLRKALPQSVQKQLAEAEAALAASAGLRKPGKRSRKPDAQRSPGAQQEGSPPAKRSRKAEAQQSPGARQKGSSPGKPSAKRLAPSPQRGAPAGSDYSSDASDLPEGVRRYTEPPRPQKRLKRTCERGSSGSQPVREAEPPETSAANPQMPEQPEHPSVRVSAPEITPKAAGLSAGVHADSQLHEHGESSDSRPGHASPVLQSPKVRTQACKRQPGAAASMQANGAEASAAQLNAAVQRSEEQQVSGKIPETENGSGQSRRTSPACTPSPRKKRAQVQQAEPAEASKRRKLEPFRPPGASVTPTRGRASMASLLFAFRPAQPSSAQAASPPAKPECPACDSLPKSAAAASQPGTNCLPPQPAADSREAGSAEAPGQASAERSPASVAERAKVSPTAGVKQNGSAQGSSLAAVISMKLGSLQRPDQPHGSVPSSREYIFSGRVAKPSAGANTAGSSQQAASNVAPARGANFGEDTDWSTDGQQSADQADAHADIQLGSSGQGTDAAGSAQLPHHSSKDSKAQPSRLQKAGAADQHIEEGSAKDLPAAPAEHQHAEAAFSSPPPPVRTLEDDLAEQVLPDGSAAAAAQPVKAEAPAATPQQGEPEYSLQPEQPQQELKPEQSGQQAQAPPGSEAGQSGAGADGVVPESYRAAGTVADPVVISDSDSESSDDELEVMPSTSLLLGEQLCMVRVRCKQRLPLA